MFMKRIIIAVIYLSLANSRSFSQFEIEDGSRGLHAFLEFGNTRIIIINNFIKQRNEKTGTPFFTGVPLGDAWYSVTGPRLQVNIDEKGPGQHFQDLSAVDMVIDTLTKNKSILAIGNFQYKIGFNGKDLTGWKSLVTTTQIKIDGYYINPANPPEISQQLVDTGLNVNDEVTLEFRFNHNKQLLTLHIKRVDVETWPFLASVVHDSSASRSPDVFIQEQVNAWQKQLSRFTSTYAYWPRGMQISNEKFFPSSKLAFWFVKPAHYADSSLEYKLIGGEYTDTAWHISSHLILVPRLSSNNNYTLLVRYREYPSNIEKYTFYVPPAWYQKRAFVFFALYPLGFLLIFFSTLYFARLRLKKANERRAKLALELKSIRAQLNPHFVFNALSSIQALVNKNDIDLANQYLTNFSNLLRTSLKSHYRDLTPASVDLQTMENYIKLEQLRFGFRYDIKTDSSLNLDSIDIPSLLLQPLIENAIKHGIAPLQENGRLSVGFTKQGDNLVIAITDNGRGFNVHEPLEDKYGLRLTQERISLLNKTLKGQLVDMHIASSENGTAVTLTFNHWL
jgi:two-component sensor histidine kinase